MIISEEKKIISFGIAIYIVFFGIVYFLNPDFGGARSDSTFYLNMFSAADPNSASISLENYKVATSPIYIFLIGMFHAILGSYFAIALHAVYIFFALASIYIFGRMLEASNWRTFSPIMLLFSGSGYFVAPSIWPTSDTPSVFFALLCLFAFLRRKNSLLSISGFLLISTRQSFVWLLCAFFLIECIESRRSLAKIAKISLKYVPSFFALIVTWLFFDRHLTPPLYESANTSNVFKLPNFLTSIQIGISLLAILLPFIFSKFWKFEGHYISWRKLVAIVSIAIFPLIFNFYGKEQPIGDGLGWISFLLLGFNFSVLIISCFATLGIVLFFLLCVGLDTEISLILATMLSTFIVFSLVMPVPFLRYFELSLILICSLVLAKLFNHSNRCGKIDSILLLICVGCLNFVKIIG